MWRVISSQRCHRCGGEKKGKLTEACSKVCVDELDKLHRDPAQVHSPPIRWSHVSICSTASALIGDESLPLEEKARRFRETFEKLNALSKRFHELRSTTVNASGPLSDWMTRFDSTVRSLDVLYSGEMSKVMVEHLAEFHSMHRRGEQQPEMNELRVLLVDIARTIPDSKLVLEHREFLRKFISNDSELLDDKIVLTLDGGGMKGVTTLLVLEAIESRLRAATGVDDVRIDDCVDLMIGTSTGGIIAMALCVARMRPKQVLDLYHTLSTQIFGEFNKVHALKNSIIVKYGDMALVKLLISVLGHKRLDDPDVHFADDTKRGPSGIHMALTTLDLQTSRLVLLRNYELPAADDGYPITGTCKVYAVEATRSTSAAPTVFHPGGRHYPVFRVKFNKGPMTFSSGYVRKNSKDYTIIDMILDSIKDPEERERHRKLIENDEFMNGLISSDGGCIANNPEKIALLEGRKLFGARRDNAGRPIHAISIGTGKLPAKANPIYNKSITNPADRPLIGEANVRESLTALLKYAFVAPATETEETDEYVQRLYGSASDPPKRINPPISKHIELDDTSQLSMELMMRDTRAWLAGEEGTRIINETVDILVKYSGRLRRIWSVKDKAVS